MGNASAVSGPPKYVTYILQTEDPGTEEVLTAFGVCNAQPDDSCLQVVYWNSRAHTTAARSPASAAGISVLPPAPSSALREVVMYVDAEGRCFMLAPSSVVSVGGAEVTSETGFTTSSSNQGGKDGDGLRDGAGAAALNADGGPYAYWLIPSVLKDLFLALLWARSHWRAAGRASTHSALLHGPLPSFKVQLHDSRWASTATAAEAPGAHARDYVGSAANAPVPPQQLTPSSLSKARKKKGMPRKRIRAATPPSDHALVNAEVSASQAGVSVTCRIPYVVKVTTPSASVRDVSTASNANSSQTARSCELRLPPSAVFHIGNRLTPFPPDHVL
ncbi:hypothetical protein ABL78_6542 [Leptomonas seymouri]|uniref:Uncharacterized protein n=1 Tax=Leptomonas seymouri TaxID=5684 RepID=A0A0N1PBY1_LEPSE|nr:hypothetical protein ABL78_6542 [Leptomonas seymouri]|eukprot:KPI84398.1 hypothetical protein ABL78_6542 [Leptomonas seymouri]